MASLYGSTLVLTGLTLVAYRGLEVQLKSLKGLFSVYYLAGLLKVALMLLSALYGWTEGSSWIYTTIQVDTLPNLTPGEAFLFRLTLEMFWLFFFANIGAWLADVSIFFLEMAYHQYVMAFLRFTGLNLSQIGVTYPQPENNILPPMTMASSGGGTKSPSQDAQRAIAKMEAEQKKAKVNAEAVNKKVKKQKETSSPLQTRATRGGR
jgi:hypothetical protein